ncbi:uncharacterized protein METZ01_LOCUS244272, partial [marine metagenome]
RICFIWIPFGGFRVTQYNNNRFVLQESGKVVVGV